MALLTDSVIKSLAMGKVFKDGGEGVSSLDYFVSGKYLVAASDDNSVRLYDCVAGSRKTLLNSLKYGVDLVRFTHHDYSVLCSSNNGWDETIRYWSLHDNSFLRYFKGHRQRVSSLAVSPVNDAFLSSSVDGSTRLWDLRASQCQGLLRRPGGGAALSAFDSQGLIFAVASGTDVKLFDSRAFDRGAFASFHVVYDSPFQWTSVEFSPDGHSLLGSTSSDAIFILDAYEGDVKQIFTQRRNPRKAVLQASFTPDSRYVLAGGEDGAVHVFSVEGPEVAVLRGHSGPVRNVMWNPQYASFASSCENLALWIPNT